MRGRNWHVGGIAAATGFALALSSSFAAAQSNDVAVKQYDSGGVYEGEFKDGKQHGRGTFTLPDGYEYTGDWVDGEIRGLLKPPQA